MIHDVPNQRKFKRLARLLRPMVGESILTPEGIAVCVLERLWHAALKDAPAGDIGKLSDEDIAEEIGWLGNASDLVEALVETRWLDRCETHRLIVHDWHEHCPRYLKAAFSSHGKEFAKAGKQPCLNGQAALPNITKPNLTELTELTASQAFQPASSASQFWKERWEEVRITACALRKRVQPDGELTSRNRVLIPTLVAMSLMDATAAKVISDQVEALAEKRGTSSEAKKPWGFLKKRIIDEMNAIEDKSFDRLWKAARVPPELLERKPQPA